MPEDKRWRFENGTPIYLQIINQIETDIVRGAAKPGDKIASVRAMAVAAGVTPNTVQRALTALEEKGLVATRGTSGRFVTEDAAKISALKEQKMQTIIADFFDNLTALGLSREEIIAAVADFKAEETSDLKEESGNGAD